MNFKDQTDKQLSRLKADLDAEIEKRQIEKNREKLQKQREEKDAYLKSDRFKNFIKDVKKLEDKVRNIKPSKFTLTLPIEFSLYHHCYSPQDALYEDCKIRGKWSDCDVQLKLVKNHGLTRTQAKIINEWLRQADVCIEGAVKIRGGFEQVFPEIAAAETELTKLKKEYEFFVNCGLEEKIVRALEDSLNT